MLLLTLKNLGFAAGAPIPLPPEKGTIREPRYVVAIMYGVSSIYMTSKAGMTNVPGDVLQGCIKDIGSTTQRLVPREGRATIGGLSVISVDLGGALTTKIRNQLNTNLSGLRGKEIRVWEGDSDDFNMLTREETYVIDRVQLSGVEYEFSASDRTRELRKDLFDLVSTTLSIELAVDASGPGSALFVDSTDGFNMFQHGPAYSHAPGEMIGYLRIVSTGEILGYTEKGANYFGNLQRGLFGTTAAPIATQPGVAIEQQPEIEEYVYLEGPGPLLKYMLMTGYSDNTSSARVMPPSWTQQISRSYVRWDSFAGIGADLFDPLDESLGFVLVFRGLDKLDGKQFIEEQLDVPMGTFSPVSGDGVIGLKRLSRVLLDAPYRVQLDETNLKSIGPLVHVQDELVNQLIVEWNRVGDRYSRVDILKNEASILKHGAAPPERLSLDGLTVQQHTRESLNRLMERYGDRWGEPPETQDVEVSSALSYLQVGDVVRNVQPGTRDYAGAGTLDRSMEVQSRTLNRITGRLSLSLFGSTTQLAAATEVDGPVLADAYYESEGTLLSSVLTISGNTITTNGTITGGDDLRTSVFYWPGNLTVQAGVTVNIDDNVFIKVRGTFTNNGTINGAGRGISAIADQNQTSAIARNQPDLYLPTFGHTRPSAGLVVSGGSYYSYGLGGNVYGAMETVPSFSLSVESGNLVGMPSELRGSPGQPGGPTISGVTVVAVGGAGGAGGSGLAILCRAFVSGVNGMINASGANGSSPGGTFSVGGRALYAGAGGGGAPGACLIILDGPAVYPDLNGKFTANHGTTPTLGNRVLLGPAADSPATPWTGWGQGIGSSSMVQSAVRVQYVPDPTPPGAGADDEVPVPRITRIEVTTSGALVHVTPLAPGTYESIEIFASITNQLPDAVMRASGPGSVFHVAYEGKFTFWYWARARDASGRVSAWSSEATDGVMATAGFPTVPPITLSNVFSETFDAYATVHDLMGEWDIYVDGVQVDPANPMSPSLPGTPVVQILAGGMNGGKVVRFFEFNTVRMVAKRAIPYDVSALYQCKLRLRRAGTFSGDVDHVWCGFFSLGTDGATIHEGGNFATGTPTWAVLDDYSSGNIFGTAWHRAFAWVASSNNAAQGTGAGGISSPAQLLNNHNVHPALPVAMRNSSGGGLQPSYILPVIQVRASVLQEIDSLHIDRIVSDPLQPGVLDGNFSSADDSEFWTAYPLPNGFYPEMVPGSGPSGSNAIWFRNVSSAYQLTAHARFPIKLSGNTITIAFEYDFVTNGPAIDNATFVRFRLTGLKAGNIVSRRYVATSTPAVTTSVSVGGGPLSTGGWARSSVVFNNVYSSSLVDADAVQLSVEVRGALPTENFDFGLARIRLNQT